MTQEQITAAQIRLPRRPLKRSSWAWFDYLRCARWWELEARRGYPSSRDSLQYAVNMRWAAELTMEHGPGSWTELKTKVSI